MSISTRSYKCCILLCPNNSTNNNQQNYRLHRLPKNEITRKHWCKWIGNQNSVEWVGLMDKSLYVCSDHFADRDKGAKKLVAHAVPCIPESNVDQNVGDQNVYQTASGSTLKHSSLPGNSQTATKGNEQLSLEPQNVKPVASSSNSCCVKSCKSKASNATDEGFHLHKIPADINTKNKWLHWIAEQNGVVWTSLTNKFMFVCSKHFADDMKGKKRLKSGAVPSISFPSQIPVFQASLQPVLAVPQLQTEPTLYSMDCTFETPTIVTDDPYEHYSSVIEIDMNSAVEQTRNFPGTSWDLCNEAFGMTVETVFVAEDLSTSILVNENLSSSLENCVIDPGITHNESFQTQMLQETVTDNVQSQLNTEASVASTSGSSRQRIRSQKQNKRCAAKGCSSHCGKRFFSFPATMPGNMEHAVNLERCKIWIQRAGDKDLLNIPTSNLHGKHFLCGDHFTTDQFYNTDCVTLLPTAIPSIFHQDSLLDQDMEIYPVQSLQERFRNLSGNHFDDLQLKFEEQINSYKWVTCDKCNERFFARTDSKKTCQHSANVCPLYSKENDMDPLDVPPELKDLTWVEEQLIARVHPLISIFKLKGHTQFGYRGNIINFPQNVKALALDLPHKVKDLSSLVTIRTHDKVNPVDFQVRSGKVYTALKYLIANNHLYSDVQISEENLSILPSDGNVFEEVAYVVDDSDPSNDNDYTEDDDLIDPDEPPAVSETCLPMIGEPSQSDKAAALLEWPDISKECINEFTTVGYIAMAFPCLFPKGQADLRNPREKRISPLKYFQHLMQYKDERFAKHPRFRYFALNSIMRWSALTNGKIFVKKNSEFRDMKKTDLKEKIEENRNIMKKIMFYNSNLRGTRAYWYARGQELLAMVRQLSLPTLFFTLSAADLHWPDLYKFLSPNEDPNSISDAKRRKLVEENPCKVDTFFLERGDAFINEVLRQKFNVKDLWYRIEYQHRGSPHIHGVLWLDGAPQFSDLAKASDEQIQEIVQYFDKYISTYHPDPNCPPAQTHPCRTRLSEVLDLNVDLAELLNRVQRHTKCTEGYCLRKSRKTGKFECRFKFPFEFRETSTLIFSDEKGVELQTARNDRWLNKYNKYMIQTWRANIDISPVLSKRALVNYLAKYITKSETHSKDLLEVLKNILQNSDDDTNAKSIIQRLYIQACCERDFSAQETCHLLMGLPLCKAGGRKFVVLNFKVLDSECWVPMGEDNAKQGKSFIEKYMERPAVFETQSLMYMAKNISLPNGRRHSHGLQAIVQVFPRILESTKEENDSFYRQQVLLYVPWRFEDQILDKYESWENAYKMNEASINEQSRMICNIDNIQPDESQYEEVAVDDGSLTEEFMYVARMGPSQRAEQIELGRRDMDVNFNWHEALNKYKQYGDINKLKSFVRDQKKETTTDTRSSEAPAFPNVQFTDEQESVLKLLKYQIESLKTSSQDAPDFALPKTVIIQGKAGTGKSLLIHAMTSLIHNAFGNNAYVLLGPTGVSALNINGSTIHSKLYMQVKSREVLPLRGAALHEFRQKFEGVKFVIIDEYSMVGCGMLNNIEKRLREAMDREDLPYGGLFVYFFGDVQQLAPVGDSPVYSTEQKSAEYINGKLLFKTIDGSITLSKVQRQSNVEFQNVLQNVCSGNITRDDYHILKQRFQSSVSSEERASFKNSIHLYPTRKEVETFNCDTLQKLKVNGSLVPIARVPAWHNCPSAAKGLENEAGGLRPVLYLAPGAKIMLRANLWTERGLVNGAIGTIIDILYEEECSPPEDPPIALICHFECYKGPYLDNEKKTIVLETLTKSWKNKKGEDCVREQFPVSLSYACSIHKSQGLTLEKACINIGPLKEMSAGLTYTALSRVKSLPGMMLEPFGFQRLNGLNSKTSILNRQNWIEELEQKSIRNLL